MEKLENQRKDFGKKALNDNFVMSNEMMKREKELKRHHENKFEKNEKYTFFPFVNGEMVEEGRKHLGNQLKHDLQSYMDY